MKVLHITNNYPTESYPVFGIFVKEQIQSLENIGIHNEVFFINSRENGKVEYLISYFRLIWKLLINKFDLIHCHHAFSAFICIATLISIPKKKIISYQSSPDIEGGKKLFILNKILFNKIIFKADYSTYKSKKIIYLPNGCNMNFFNEIDSKKSKEILGLNLNKKYISFFDSYVGRTYKRYDRFKNVLNILEKKYNINNVEELLLTNIERKNVPYYINASSLHLLSSDIEGSPNSVKECLACNIPVVSTPVGNVREMISEIQGCYVSNSFNEEELAELVFKALKKNRINGREKLIEKQLDIESVALKLKTIYIEILK